MPTPNRDRAHPHSTSAEFRIGLQRALQISYSPEEQWYNPWISADGRVTDVGDLPSTSRLIRTRSTTTSLENGRASHASSSRGEISSLSESKSLKIEEQTSATDVTSPISTASETDVGNHGRSSPLRLSSLAVARSYSISSMCYDFSNIRLLPNPLSSFLRAGSQYSGTQQSDKQVYDVQVEIKQVDVAESTLCGYLRIQGLTDDHPTLTTYFDGEIIGDKYSYQTKHPDWGSSDKVDMQHWARFNAWRAPTKSSRKSEAINKDFMQRENVFMRWKERFLVPDHRVRTISGASFEGFYYICFNQASGNVSGIYFHAKSEKYQQLELTHIDDRGSFGALEFR